MILPRAILTALACLTYLALPTLGAILIVKQDPNSVPRSTFQPGHYEGDGPLPNMQPRFVYDTTKKDASRDFTVRLDSGEKGFCTVHHHQDYTDRVEITIAHGGRNRLRIDGCGCHGGFRIECYKFNKANKGDKSVRLMCAEGKGMIKPDNCPSKDRSKKTSGPAGW